MTGSINTATALAAQQAQVSSLEDPGFTQSVEVGERNGRGGGYTGTPHEGEDKDEKPKPQPQRPPPSVATGRDPMRDLRGGYGGSASSQGGAPARGAQPGQAAGAPDDPAAQGKPVPVVASIRIGAAPSGSLSAKRAARKAERLQAAQGGVTAAPPAPPRIAARGAGPAMNAGPAMGNGPAMDAGPAAPAMAGPGSLNGAAPMNGPMPMQGPAPAAGGISPQHMAAAGMMPPGMSHPGMQQPGMSHGGMQQPGMAPSGPGMQGMAHGMPMPSQGVAATNRALPGMATVGQRSAPQPPPMMAPPRPIPGAPRAEAGGVRVLAAPVKKGAAPAPSRKAALSFLSGHAGGVAEEAVHPDPFERFSQEKTRRRRALDALFDRFEGMANPVQAEARPTAFQPAAPRRGGNPPSKAGLPPFLPPHPTGARPAPGFRA